MQTPKKVLSTDAKDYTLISLFIVLFSINYTRVRSDSFAYFMLALTFGLIAGFLIQHRLTKRKLKRVEQDGYYKSLPPSPVSARIGQQILSLLLLGLVMVVALSVYAIFKAQFWVVIIINCSSGLMLASFLTKATYFWGWQRKNKRTLLTFDNILYPYPYMDQPTNKETSLQEK